MKKFHIAISTDKIEETVFDYSLRLGSEPCLVIPGEYALWRTESLNVSIRRDAESSPGSVRHLGWEDSEATESTEEPDANGLIWEHFSADHQAKEINDLWPDAAYEV